MSIFRSSPNFTKGYVATGLSIIKLCLTPIQLLMRHLCEVSGLDPNMDADQIRRDQFEYMVSSGSPCHYKDYDEDFDWNFITNFPYLKYYLKHLINQPTVNVALEKPVHSEGLGSSELKIQNEDLSQIIDTSKYAQKEAEVAQDPVTTLRQVFQNLSELSAQQETDCKTHQEVIDAMEKVVLKPLTVFNPGDALTKLADIIREPKLVVSKKPRTNKRKSKR